jgi:hypothetical protein
MNEMQNIAVNSFVKRQTSESRFSHYTGSWDELVEQVETNFHSAKAGYREGVILVPVDAGTDTVPGFFSGVMQLTEKDGLIGSFEARRDGETPRKAVTTTGRNKLSAKSVDIVLYASTVLAEDGSNELGSVEGNWEIISINANPFNEEMPIDPNVLMHNHFGSEGGTDTNLSDEEFVAMLRTSFEFWKDKAMCG